MGGRWSEGVSEFARGSIVGPYALFGEVCVVGRLASLSVPVFQGGFVLLACEWGTAGLLKCCNTIQYNLKKLTICLFSQNDLIGKLLNICLKVLNRSQSLIG